MSLSMRLAGLALRAVPRTFRTPEAVRRTAARRRRHSVPLTLRCLCRVREDDVAGFPVITLTPRRSSGRELVYLHGGAYVFPLREAHWWIISALIRRTGATVTVPLYGLAPEHSVAEALPFVDAVSKAVARRSPGAPLFLAGDSAGGGLALAHVIDRRNRRESQPEAVFLFAPWLDCTMSNPAIPPLVRQDPMLDVPGLIYCANLWARGRPLDSWQVSPINDTLKDLPPVCLFQGGRDILFPDAERLAAKAAATSSPVELHVAPDGFHVYVAATFTPESRRALARVAQRINDALQ
ncbi:alpha/beta hydrolase [Arthrobacter gengyunqii]|uniref:Alpha/beta hydrolase n=1 Tax=Arthrobacter gengyunqii TaxID=2886940 RepID=A0A9X1M011_9MICC|nr:alpha/beta hydrolase [Arthrobacter gengyunqii]MCC3268764.1 alpha/beta hydrolase [Arthrobacter gengyunqii]UOY96148.1 alpha/beta hydrolase [Arthrobacter gengyunqii]